MNEKEHQELNRWIAEYVMGWHIGMSGSDPYEDGECWFNAEGKFPCVVPSFTADAAASDALDDAILKKLDCTAYRIHEQGGMFVMVANVSPQGSISAAHQDKKVCRVLFCQKLFTAPKATNG